MKKIWKKINIIKKIVMWYHIYFVDWITATCIEHSLNCIVLKECKRIFPMVKDNIFSY